MRLAWISLLAVPTFSILGLAMPVVGKSKRSDKGFSANFMSKGNVER